jgi:glyoxylase-like metal-dependent hydrolase (beta-lactamase superfamily II)
MAHWLDDGRMAQVSPRQRRDNFEAARHQLAAYRDRIRMFGNGNVLPNIEAVAMQGHTPGHTGYRITSGLDALLIWGDLVHLPDIQIAHPDVRVVLDTDKHQAADMRKRVLGMCVADRVLVTGMHLPFPGFSHVVWDRGGYALIHDRFAE